MKITSIFTFILIALYAFSSSAALRAEQKLNLEKMISEKVEQQLTKKMQDYERRKLADKVPPSSERISDYLQYNKNVGSKEQHRIMLSWYSLSSIIFAIVLKYVPTADLSTQLGQLNTVKKYLWAATTSAIGLTWYQIPKWIYQEWYAADAKNLQTKKSN